jgi:hypothetical protein
MAATQREERSLLGHEGFALVAPSHYPTISTLPPEELKALATRLREAHGKARDLIREGRRARSGKGTARAAAGQEAGKATLRKQVYAAALKRVNSRFEALTHDRRKEANRAALREALARRQAMRPHHPTGGDTAGGGMRSKPSGKRRSGVLPAKVGRVSQQNKAAQARRDG